MITVDSETYNFGATILGFMNVFAVMAAFCHMHHGGGGRRMADGRPDQRGDIRHQSFKNGGWSQEIPPYWCAEERDKSPLR